MEREAYSISDLLKRWRWLDSCIFTILLSAFIVCMLLCVRELRDNIVVWLFALIIWIITFVFCLKLFSSYKKIKRIVANQLVINTRIIWALSPGTRSSTYRLKSTYFDDKSSSVYQFRFAGEINKKLVKGANFKQGRFLEDLQTINVCVNKYNYNDYVVLFEEEWNVESKKKVSN